jgi:hypothetical protein
MKEHLQINVREYQRGKQKWRKWQHEDKQNKNAT